MFLDNKEFKKNIYFTLENTNTDNINYTKINTCVESFNLAYNYINVK